MQFASDSPNIVPDSGTRIFRPRGPPPQQPREVNPHGESCGSCVSWIPEDILLGILEYLGAMELARCKEVCILERIINSDTRLNYRLELAINGVVEGPASAGLSVHERLQRLQDYRKRFRGVLVYKPVVTANERPEPLNNGSSCVQIDNTIAYVVKHGNGTNRLVAYQPPSLCQEHTAPAEVCVMPPLVEVAGMDMSQRLVVLCRWDPAQTINNRATMFLLTILPKDIGLQAPSVIHPQARHPRLDISFPRRPSPCFLGLQIYGPYMAWCTKFLRDPLPLNSDALCNDDAGISCSLEVWDWKAGRQVWRGYFTNEFTFTFLDNAYILVSEGGTSKLLVYRFLNTQTALDRESFSKNPAGRIFSLTHPYDVKTCVLNNPCALTPPAPLPKAFFVPDPRLRAIVMDFENNNKLRTMFLSAAALIDQVDALWANRAASTPSAPEIPWARSLCCTTSIPAQAEHNAALHSVFASGSKVAYIAGDDDRPTPVRRLVIMDLNPLSRAPPVDDGGCTQSAGGQKKARPWLWPACSTHKICEGMEDAIDGIGMHADGLTISVKKDGEGVRLLHYILV